MEHPWVDTTVGAFEDAAVLRPAAGPPLVLTVDFITPIVDDAETFGAIAAANALSDVYAMGGEPQVALVVAGVPADRLPQDVLARIFRGGRDKAAEAGCAVVGGHTVKDTELKYGLCVLGTCAEGRVLAQVGARPGDALVLTKPLGMGVVSQAVKQGVIAPPALARAIAVMTTLNKAAKDAALAADVHAATDVTGFGLLGHLRNMLVASGVSARLDAPSVPVLEGVRALAEAGLIPGGSRGNLAAVAPYCTWDDGVDETTRVLLADAQTSGGLLLAVPPDRLAPLLERLAAGGTPARAVIGRVDAGRPGVIRVGAGAA